MSSDVSLSILDLIGDTPILKLSSFDTGPCELYVKLELQNPGGSIKDRIALSIIEDAERSGQLVPGGTIIEATAGNTGIGLALVGALKGYRVILVIPDKMSREKIFHLEGLGASVVMTRSDVPEGHPEYYQDLARAIASDTTDSFLANQFSNPSNPAAHRTQTAPEIWRQMDCDIDAVVTGVGSGGTITGLAEFLKEKNPQIEMVVAATLKFRNASLHNFPCRVVRSRILIALVNPRAALNKGRSGVNRCHDGTCARVRLLSSMYSLGLKSIK